MLAPPGTFFTIRCSEVFSEAVLSSFLGIGQTEYNKGGYRWLVMEVRRSVTLTIRWFDAIMNDLPHRYSIHVSTSLR